MLQNTYIKKFFAALLLLVFALSITPTKVLHSLFANHKDSRIKNYVKSKTPGISVAGFNCSCDGLVVISPYTSENSQISFVTPKFPNINKSAPVSNFHCADTFFFELRGPPVRV